MHRLTLIPLLMLLTACSGVAPVTRQAPASPVTSASSAIDGKTRHAGIYLEQNRFLHASKSSGIMISPLHSPYWQSGRVL